MGIAPLFLRIFGEVPLKQCYVAVLGYWLFGMTCIAIGTFISAITESQVIAAVLTFVVLFAGYMMAGITQVISSTGTIITRLLNGFNLTNGMDSFFNGILDIEALVYYLSLILLFLFFTTQAIQKRRWSMSTKKMKLGVFSSGMIAAALAAAIAVNLTASQLPKKISAIDMTAQKLYSITKDTEKILDGLKEDITIYVLAKKDSQDEMLLKTLERYQDYSKHIKVEYKDPAVSPSFYKEYTDTALTSNSLIVVGENRSKVIDYNNIYEPEIDYKILEAYQVTIESGIVVEGNTSSYYKNPYYLLLEVGSDPVTANTTDGYIFAPFCQGLNYPKTEEEEENSITYTPLLTTSADSFAKKDITTADDYSKGEKDTDGPFAVGLRVSKALGEEGKSIELYVFGGVNLFTDNASQQVYGNNLNLFTGITSQCTQGEPESVIPVKSYTVSQLTVNQTIVTAGMLILLVVIPLGLLAAGIIIRMRRRKR